MVNASFNLLLLPIPASPSTFEHERADVITRSTNNHRTILSIPVSAPLMPLMPLMPDLTKKTELSNAQLPVPVPTLPTKTKKMKKTKSKQVLRQIKRGLLLEFISSKHQLQEEGCGGCSSGRTSTTVSTATSTSSLIMATPQSQSQSQSFIDDMTKPILLTPRFRMFQEDEVEDEQHQQHVTMIKPAAPWSTQQVVAVVPTTITQPTPSLLSASLNKALSVLSVSSNDHDDDDGDNDEDDDDWGIFVSIDDTDDDEEHDRKDSNNYDWYSPLDNRSYLPVSFAESLWNQ